MSRRKKTCRFGDGNDEIELSMTPMIDVVFQLLIYFLVTFTTPDVLANLDISRPSPDAKQQDTKPPANMIRVVVLPVGGMEAGYAINGRAVTAGELSDMLRRLAGISTKQSVVITCDDKTVHGKLVRVLDICAENKLTNLSVISGQ